MNLPLLRHKKAYRTETIGSRFHSVWAHRPQLNVVNGISPDEPTETLPRPSAGTRLPERSSAHLLPGAFSTLSGLERLSAGDLSSLLGDKGLLFPFLAVK